MAYNGVECIQVAHGAEQQSHLANVRLGSSVKTVTVQTAHLELSAHLISLLLLQYTQRGEPPRCVYCNSEPPQSVYCNSEPPRCVYCNSEPPQSVNLTSFCTGLYNYSECP